jgi:hypothetical protein
MENQTRFEKVKKNMGSFAFSFLPVIMYGWRNCSSYMNSLLYSHFKYIYLGVACAAYTQCLGGVVGAAILCCILPLTMYI